MRNCKPAGLVAVLAVVLVAAVAALAAAADPPTLDLFAPFSIPAHGKAAAALVVPGPPGSPAPGLVLIVDGVPYSLVPIAATPPGPPKPPDTPFPAGDLAGLVRQWVAAVKGDPKKAESATALVDNFRIIATQAASGEYATPSEMEAATRASNRARLGTALDAWRDPFFAPLAAWLGGEQKAGRFVTKEDAVRTWRSIADALAAAAKAGATK